MTRRRGRTIAGIALALALGVVGVGCWAAFASDSDSTSSNPVDTAKTSALNAAIDASGIKTIVSDTLESRVFQISTATGLSASEVESATSNLDIENWTATTLPNDAVASSSVDATVSGVDATVTTYEDPSYVTVQAYGQKVTFSLPESAQGCTDYLSYLG